MTAATPGLGRSLSLRELRPSRGDLESIERSLDRLLRKPGRDARVIGKFRQIEARA